MKNTYDSAKKENISKIQVSPQFGLSSEQVKERIAAHADNHKVESSTQSVSDIIKSNVFTYFNLVFVVIAVLLALVAAWRDMLFLPVIIANTLIGIIQEIHSKRVLDRLARQHAPQSVVVRDGQKKKIASDKLVIDDIVELSAGSQVPADCEIAEGQIWVNESLITGESDEIEKTAGDELLSGSFVVAGKALVRLTSVGEDSYISKLTIQATKSKKGEQSEMIRSLNNLIKVMGILIIPIGAALFIQSFFYNEGTLHDSVTGMVAAVLGMIPEGLYLLASVAMAVSAARLAKKKVLIHDMKCIETLARVNVLCVDKTGTITEPGMKVYETVALDGVDKDETEKLFSDFSHAQQADNETMQAVQEYFKKRKKGLKPKKVFPFTSRTKYSAALMDDDKSYVLGAPELVLREQYASYEEIITSYGSRGYRVLVFAEYEGTLEGQPLISPVKPYMLIMLANPIREGAKETFTYFAENDVRIKVISGDNPLTVSVIAEQAGIEDADSYVDATTLETDADYEEAVEKYTVFGRVTPDQKRHLVRALKKQKKTVAMTGDGVNDVLALKDADCSVAMASGSDAASNVAQIVLLDSDFTKMPAVVAEGRSVVNNIERTASLYIVKNMFSMLLSIFSVILLLDYPLVPAQVSLITMFTIGIPSFFLALEPNKKRIEGHFLTNVLLRALPAGLTDFIVVSAMVLFCREFMVDADCVSTSCSIILAIVGFMILYRIAKPMNLWHVILIAAMIIGWVFSLLYLSAFFGITGISKQCAMLLVVFAVNTEPLLRYLSLIVETICEKVRNKRRQRESRLQG
jgi:cation-transporting ATPase E